MERDSTFRFLSTRNPTSPIRAVILACLVAALSYFAPRLVGALILNRSVWGLRARNVEIAEEPLQVMGLAAGIGDATRLSGNQGGEIHRLEQPALEQEGF